MELLNQYQCSQQAKIFIPDPRRNDIFHLVPKRKVGSSPNYYGDT